MYLQRTFPTHLQCISNETPTYLHTLSMDESMGGLRRGLWHGLRYGLRQVVKTVRGIPGIDSEDEDDLLMLKEQEKDILDAYGEDFENDDDDDGSDDDEFENDD